MSEKKKFHTTKANISIKISQSSEGQSISRREVMMQQIVP